MKLWFKNSFVVGILFFLTACGVGLKPRSLSTDAPSLQSTSEVVGGETVSNDSENNNEENENTPDSESLNDESSMNSASSSEDLEESDDSNESNDEESDMGLRCFEIYRGIGGCYDAYYACAYDCPDEDCRYACEEGYYLCFEEEVSLGSEQAQEEFYELRSCEEEYYNGCYDTAIEYYDDCAGACTSQTCVDECAEQANTLYSECMIENCNDEYILCGLIEGNLEE